MDIRILLGFIGIALSQIHYVYFMSDLLLYKGQFRDNKLKWEGKTQKKGQYQL